VFRYPSTIQFADTDASRRIWYGALFRHLDAAENAFMRRLGLRIPGDGYVERSWGSPRAHVEADFRVPLEYNDDVEVEVRVDRVGSTSYTLGFTVWKGETEAATASMTIVILSMETARPIALPDDLLAGLHRAADL